MDNKYTCNHCNRILSSISSLNYHQKTAKFCLKIQKENKVEINQKYYICEYCKFEFTNSHHLSNHLNCCKVLKIQIENDKINIQVELKYNKMKEEAEIKYNKLIEEANLKYNKMKEKYEIKYNKLKEKYTILQTTLKNLKVGSIEKEKIVKDEITFLREATQKQADLLASKGNIITNNHNKIINMITTPLDASKFTEQLKHLQVKDLKSKETLAKFIDENSFIDDDGNPMVYCTDKTRATFHYLDSNNKLYTDNGGMELIKKIEPVIKPIVTQICANNLKTDENSINPIKDREKIFNKGKLDKRFAVALAKVTHLDNQTRYKIENNDNEKEEVPLTEEEKIYNQEKAYNDNLLNKIEKENDIKNFSEATINSNEVPVEEEYFSDILEEEL
jgi:hypothetical protein